MFFVFQMPTGTKVSFGFFGSSHIEHYPLFLFRFITSFISNITPFHISSSPKNIQSILSQNTVEQTIKSITERKIKLDFMVILVGANDIGTLSPKQIAEGIIYIAKSFANINIFPIIVPIFNRESPRYKNKTPMPQHIYNSSKNKINKILTQHYKKQNMKCVLNIRTLKLTGDGVHLTPSSYQVLTKTITHHINRTIMCLYTKIPPGHYHDKEKGEELIIEDIYEEN